LSQLSNFHDLDLGTERFTWHTIVYHSSTSTYIPNFFQIGKDIETSFIRSSKVIVVLCSNTDSFISFSFISVK